MFLSLFISHQTQAQISTVCTDPTNVIYGLTAGGAIYPINVNTAATGSVTKNTTYSGNGPTKSNALGYNSQDGKFYYFKRNVGTSPQEFVSFTPTTNTVSILANCPLPSEIHTGCIAANGLGYYTIDIDANMAYYNISTNSWTSITSTFKDQYNNDVSSIIKSQSAGDIAIDGNGNLWIITSNSSNFGVYKLSGPLPTSATTEVTVTQVLAPTTATPSNNMIAGIAFNTTGQIYLSTKNDNRLYRLENTLTTTYVGTFSTSDVGNDLTSCVFPMSVLPVTWLNFDAVAKGKKTIEINWDVLESRNTGFYIQHSTDGHTWQEIAFVQSKVNDNNIHRYSHTHFNEQNGKQFYRLKQVDTDKKESYSTIKTVTLTNEVSGVSIWPNPATETLNFYNMENDPFTKAFVFDLSGRKVIEKPLREGLNTINISILNKGIYILKLEGSNPNAITKKIIKQ